MKYCLWIVASLLVVITAIQANAKRIIKADTTQEIVHAVATAKPGDIIVIPPGQYTFDKSLVLDRPGTAAAPITLRTQGVTGYAMLRFTGDTSAGVRMSAPWWILRGLHIYGNKHFWTAIAVNGQKGARHLVIRNCKISHSHGYLIKANRNRSGETGDVKLLHNDWYHCGNTALDLDGGSHWLIRGNYVHDFSRNPGPHYGIFLKGGVSHSIIEGNFVDGGHKSNAVGISLGGGLMGRKFMPKGWSGVEVTDSIVRDNIVINTGDYAYHANHVSGARYYNNLAYNCKYGFQRQHWDDKFPPDPVLVNNILSGIIVHAGSLSHNLVGSEQIKWNKWFVDPAHGNFVLTPAGKAALTGKGVWVTGNPVDYFGNKRWKSLPQTLGPVIADAFQTSTVWVDSRAATTADATGSGMGMDMGQ